MRHKILAAAAAAFVLTSVGAAPFALADQPSVAAMKKAGREKNPAAADATIAKFEAKDAKKQAHRAYRKAKVAWRNAKVAAVQADRADNPRPSH